MTRLRWLAAVALLIAVGGGAWWYFAARPLAVPVAGVETNVPIRVFGLGTVEARVLSRVGFEVPGMLVAVAADHGDAVREDATLARLDTATQAARVSRAEALVRSATAAVQRAEAQGVRLEAQLALRQSTARRRRELADRAAGSLEAAETAETEVTTAQADVTVNRADVMVARAALAEAEANLLAERVALDKHTLRAPFAARVVARLREPGSALAAGADVFTLVQPDTIWALVYVDEGRAGGLRLGQPASLALRSRPGERFAAQVVRIGIESDRVTEERRVYLACRDCPADMFLGEQVEAVIDVATLPSARLVPEAAAQGFDGATVQVWTIEDGRLAQRRVRVAARTLDARFAVVDVLDTVAIATQAGAGFSVGRPARVRP